MDFNNTPDFGDLPLPNTSNSQTTPDFPPPPAVDIPPTPTEAADNAAAISAAPASVDKKQFIYTLLIALFITLLIGGIAIFAIGTYLKSIAKTPQPLVSGIPALPTQAPTLPQTTPSSAIAPTTATNDWTIRMKQASITMSLLDSPQISTISATVFGPIENDTYLCTAATPGNTQYFTIKNSDVFERLCDSTLEPEPQKLTCAKYDTNLGVSIKQTLYPKTDCANGDIEAGTYVMYSKVYSNCDLDGKPLNNVTTDACTDTVEVYSEEMTLEE